MNETELYYLLRLSITQNIGYIIGRRLINEFGSAEAVFTASKAQILAVNMIGNTVYNSLHQSSIDIDKKVNHEIKLLKEFDIKPLSILDNLYPEHLLNCYDAPFLLFTKGDIDLKNKKIISIVGTRSITKYGIDFCELFFNEIASYNPIVVSGLAYGTDILVHKLAIKHNLQTIAVLPTGINNIYPKDHQYFCSDICKNGGLISEFWSNKFPEKENFVKRNRIIAGMSIATVLIESGIKGGSLITTSIANDYDREVFALPGRVTDLYSKGCNDLIKNYKAHILNSPSDFIRGLNWDVFHKPVKEVQTKMFLELLPKEQLIVDYLEKNGKTFFDVLAVACNIHGTELNTILLNLELNGIIKNIPGKFFDLK
jgi:DNA processing protein